MRLPPICPHCQKEMSSYSENRRGGHTCRVVTFKHDTTWGYTAKVGKQHVIEEPTTIFSCGECETQLEQEPEWREATA